VAVDGEAGQGQAGGDEGVGVGGLGQAQAVRLDVDLGESRLAGEGDEALQPVVEGGLAAV
jgi:hypothetical protein